MTGAENEAGNDVKGSFYFSYPADISISPGDLCRFIDEKMSGGLPYSSISHIYIENPFSLTLDSRGERKEKQGRIASLAEIMRSFDIKPVFVFDYTCMGDHHLTADFQKRFGGMAAFLDSVGITAISLADLYLAETFSSSFPPYSRFSHFEVYISPYAKINHAVKLKYLDTFDYRMITLHPDINRDKEEIRRVLKRIGSEKAEIVMDSPCIARCPLETFCRALRFHLREERMDPGEKEKAASYYRDQCEGWLREDPSVKEQVPVISPEEIPGYAEVEVKYFRYLFLPQRR